MAALRLKCMSATNGMCTPWASSCSRIFRLFFASPMPWTVSRTMSAPASLHRRICSTDAWTSFVSVVPMVWSTMGSELPILTWPTFTVDVERL